MTFRFVRSALALMLAATAMHASAQDFPNRAITMVMPYAAGGPGDTITRVFAGAMQKHLGQQIVVDNTAGASGSIGTAKVARARPDGYTLLMIHVSHATNVAMYKGLSYHRLTTLSRLAAPPAAPWSSSPAMISGAQFERICGLCESQRTQSQPGACGCGLRLALVRPHDDERLERQAQ